MADEDTKIKDLPRTESVNDDDDVIIEDASPTTYRIHASDLRTYIAQTVQETIDQMGKEITANTNAIDELNTSLIFTTIRKNDVSISISTTYNLNSDGGIPTPDAPDGYERVFYAYSTAGSGHVCVLSLNSSWCRNISSDSQTITGIYRYDLYAKKDSWLIKQE